MEFTLGYFRSGEQVVLRGYSHNSAEVTEKIIPVQDLNQFSLQSLFYQENLLTDDLKSFIGEEGRFYPIYGQEQFNLAATDLEQMNTEKAWGLLHQSLSKWILVNNISTLEEIFHLSSYFKDMWKSDYHALFEELWFVIKSNLGAQELKIFFNDLATDSEGKDKKALQTAVASGTRVPHIQAANEAENELVKNYKKFFGTHFEVLEFDQAKGHFVAVAQLMGGPLLIMAKVYHFNRLQKALIKSLFEGLQESEAEKN